MKKLTLQVPPSSQNISVHGRVTLLDDEDFEIYSNWRWRLSSKGYALRVARSPVTKKMVSLLLHRVIMGAKSNQRIDHINGNSLDNRKCNLRFATQQQNMQNRKVYRNNTSGYKGVRKAPHGKWRASICYNYMAISLGYYKSATEAAEVYNIVAKDLFGEFAKLNSL